MDIYDEIVRLRRAGRPAAMATIIMTRGSVPSFATAKMLVRDDGSILGTVGGGMVEAEVIKAARQVIEQERPQTVEVNLRNEPGSSKGPVCGGGLAIFVEPILPAPVLYIFGGGHVGLSAHRFARAVGFDTVVIDERPEFASRDRYPDAQDVIAENWDSALARIKPARSSYILLVTKGYQDDMRVLRWAVDTPAGYIGMIGSRRKVLTVYKELQKDGVPPEKLERVRAPVGLDIGATTPEEIAVSVIAEIIAVRRHATAALPHKRSHGMAAANGMPLEAVG